MFRATLNTGSFDFDAYGTTADAAVDTLRNGWQRHAKKTSATYTWAELSEDVNVTEIALGACYRDGSKI